MCAKLHWNWRSSLEVEIGDAHALADIMQGRNPPDALVCANDRKASFAIRTLVERILHRDLPPREILLAAELVRRRSA